MSLDDGIALRQASSFCLLFGDLSPVAASSPRRHRQLAEVLELLAGPPEEREEHSEGRGRARLWCRTEGPVEEEVLLAIGCHHLDALGYCSTGEAAAGRRAIWPLPAQRQ